ncbi:CRIB domain-containing protein RIC10-like isoform X2 [Cornus florida]|nr:CRIB domain-containing protein RIC10-like isoform X2 [Cornus florida]XP_059623969.1 CRIB domain-containing protein RIC10-like isoform X2 [Cornus florida]
MAMKIKGICKGFKYISQIFVVKEREMEIGYPTDVKHVAHIGWDGHSGSAPSWMNEFRTDPDFATTSIGNVNETRGPGSALSTWSSQDFDQMERQPVFETSKDMLPTDLPNIPKKQKRKKTKSSNSSPKSSSSTSRSSRSAKSKAKFAETTRHTNLEVV